MFIGIFSYGTWVLTGVVEEKQSRVVEVVLSTVRPRDLLMGKVLGIGAAGAGPARWSSSPRGSPPRSSAGGSTLPATTVSAVVQLLTWFILGFAFYSTAMGFLGSLASRMEEASNASMPVTMIATRRYLASILLVTQEPDGIVATVLTFFPPSAPMVVPLRDGARRDPAVGDRGSRSSLMLAAIWVLFVIGGRVYSGAVLQTGGRMKLRDAWRASR